MISHPTLEALSHMKLHGMARAYAQQLESGSPDMDFDERLAMLVETERAERDQRKFTARLRQAKLRHPATPEDVDLRSARGLNRSLMTTLLGLRFVTDALNVIFTGATGLGKTFLACALGHQGCRRGMNVRYYRLPRLLEELALGHADGRYPRMMRQLLRADILILDDWGLAPLAAEQSRDLLEVIDDRHQRKSTIITSQRPIAQWHELFADPTVADAILDRLVHGAYRIELSGESMRKTRAPDLDHGA